MLNAVIVLAKCTKTKEYYGIRFEERRPDLWEYTWAFRLRKHAAEHEGYDRGRIGGVLQLGEGFPGCPYCGGHGFFKCGVCGKITCWDEEVNQVRCAWCGHEAGLEGTITEMDSGAF